MSRDKKNAFVKYLLPLVLIIWGYVGYFFYDFFSDKNSEIVQKQEFQASRKLDSKTKKIEHTLSKLERDPFLGTAYRGKEKRKNDNPIKRETEDWPKIVLNGVVADTKNKSVIYVMLIEGKQTLLKRGDVFNGIRVISGSKDFVKVGFKNMVKTVGIE